MANYIIDKDLVIRGAASGQQRTVIWGEAVDAGKSVYLDNVSQKWLLCDPTDPTKPATTEQLGFSLSSGLLDQTGTIAQGVNNIINVGLHGGKAGECIVNRLNGAIAPAGDLAVGEVLSIVGWTTTDSQIELFPNVTGVVAT